MMSPLSGARNHMTMSWVFLFSKFTPEALLFEALGIFGLLVSYTSFYVLKKRRHGVLQADVPSGVVKGYLNELIGDAQELRTQLFGLLATSGITVPQNQRPTTAAPVVNLTESPVDAASLERVSALEAKIAEQTRTIETFMAEKARIEKDLAEARAAGAAATSASDGGPNPEIAKLQQKITGLEGKLAEYSVIEDDLANLKRLQQENAQLKSTLAGRTGGATTAANATAGAAPTAAPATASAAPSQVIDENDPLAALMGGLPESETANPAAAASGENVAFEGLVDQVEASLQSNPSDAPAAEPALAADSTSSAPAATIEKSDADLVAEFEKMLNG